jgi:hypothetical protein
MKARVEMEIILNTIINKEEVEFFDIRNNKCILSESFLSEGAILLGKDGDVVLLSREQIKELVQHLCYWLETGLFDYTKSEDNNG